MNLYEQQQSNRRKTWLVMLAFVAFFLFLGIGFDTFYIGAGRGVVPIGSVIALGVGSVSAATSYFSGDRAVLLSTHARPVEDLAAGASADDTLKLRQLQNVVDEMSIASGLPTPSIRQYTASLIIGIRTRLETKPGKSFTSTGVLPS